MKKIIEIEAGRNIELSKYSLFLPKINTIWTIYDEDEMWNHYQYNPDNGLKVDRNNLETLKPSHNYGVFLEEKLHDWDIDYNSNLLHYYSRITEQSQKVKLLIDYDTMRCQDCPNWKEGGFGEHFCNVSGSSKGSKELCEKSEKNVLDHGNVYDKESCNEWRLREFRFGGNKSNFSSQTK